MQKGIRLFSPGTEILTYSALVPFYYVVVATGIRVGYSVSAAILVGTNSVRKAFTELKIQFQKCQKQ